MLLWANDAAALHQAYAGDWSPEIEGVYASRAALDAFRAKLREPVVGDARQRPIRPNAGRNPRTRRRRAPGQERPGPRSATVHLRIRWRRGSQGHAFARAGASGLLRPACGRRQRSAGRLVAQRRGQRIHGDRDDARSAPGPTQDLVLRARLSDGGDLPRSRAQPGPHQQGPEEALFPVAGQRYHGHGGRHGSRRRQRNEPADQDLDGSPVATTPRRERPRSNSSGR